MMPDNTKTRNELLKGKPDPEEQYIQDINALNPMARMFEFYKDSAQLKAKNLFEGTNELLKKSARDAGIALPPIESEQLNQEARLAEQKGLAEVKKMAPHISQSERDVMLENVASEVAVKASKAKVARFKEIRQFAKETSEKSGESAPVTQEQESKIRRNKLLQQQKNTPNVENLEGILTGRTDVG